MIMDKILYYCKSCKKLYKVEESGRHVKCNKCQQELIDLKVTDKEYEQMDDSEKNSLKYNAVTDFRTEDTGIDSSGKSSFFDMMPADSNDDSQYEPIYAFDGNQRSVEEDKTNRHIYDVDDDPDDRKVNFFLIPVFSFVPKKYKRLVLGHGGKVFAALLVWFVILNIITGIIAAAGINEVADSLRNELPDFELANGRMTIDSPVLIDQDNTYIVVDDSLSSVTASDVDAVNKKGYYKSVFIAGSDSAGVFSDGKIQVIKYSDLSGLKISREILCDRWIPMLKPIVIICMVFGAFFSIGVYYLAALILQYPAGAIANGITKTDMGNTERFRATVLAKFPVFVLVYIIKKCGLRVGFFANVIMQMVVIVLFMYLYKRAYVREV